MSDDAPAALGAPRRLSPRTLLLNGITGLWRSAIPVGAMVVAGGSSIAAFILPLLALTVIVGTAATWLSWSRFRYTLAPDSLLIEQGVLARTARAIPYARIQDVDIERGPLHRLLGLARVRVETGGADSDEGRLDAVALPEAERLRLALRRLRDGGEPAAPAPQAAAEAAPLYAMTPRRVLILGLFNFSLVFFAVAGGAVQQFDFLLRIDIYDVDMWSWLLRQLDLHWLEAFIGSAAVGVGVAASLFTVALLGFGGGLVLTARREWNFRLDRSERGFRRRRGLFTLTDVTIPAHRIQAWAIVTGAVRQRFGWFAFAVRTLGGGSGAGEAEGSIVLAPIGRAGEMIRLAQLTGCPDAGFGVPLERGRPAAFLLDWAVTVLPLLAAAMLLLLWLSTQLPAWTGNVESARYALLAAGIAPIAALLGFAFRVAEWRSHGWALHGTTLHVARGWWRREHVLLPAANAQSVDVIAGPVGRMTGTRRLRIGIAAPGSAGLLVIDHAPEGIAQGIAGRLMEAAERIDFADSIAPPAAASARA